MPVKTVIVVRDGMVTDVYSTLPAHEHDIETLNFDMAGRISPGEKEEMEERIDEITDSPKYYGIL